MQEQAPSFNRHMSDAEALMWNLEKDPRLISSFASVSMLDAVPDLEALRKRMTRASERITRLRQRVSPTFGRLAPPEWVDDPDFDITYHVRAVGLPDGATERDLLDAAAQAMTDPFIRTRPLWQFTVFTGLGDGRAALFQKMHHTITDGEGGIQLWASFVDVERTPVDDPLATAEPGPTAEPRSRNLVDSAAAATSHLARRQLGILRRQARAVTGLVRHPGHLATAVRDTGEALASMGRQLGVVEPGRSPLWTERTMQRRLEVLSIPFRPARDAARALGVTLNDFFVAGVVGGAGAYHRAKGSPVDELRMAMPVSMRTAGSTGGNAFALSRLLVSTAEDPIERLRSVASSLGETKQERSLAMFEDVAGLANLLPTSLLVRVGLRQAQTIDFTTSNLRGSPFPVYIAGAKMLRNYPMGPIAGTAFNLTLLSYDGSLDMGLHVDAGSVDDPALLAELIQASFEELIAAA